MKTKAGELFNLHGNAFTRAFIRAGWHAIFVASDGGRLCRPLIIVADCKPRFIPEKHVPLLRGRKESG